MKYMLFFRLFRTIAFAAVLLTTLLSPRFSSAFAPQPTDGDWIDAGNNIFRTDELLNITITFEHSPTGDPNTVVDCNSDTPLTATVTFQNSVMNETVTTVGVRNRGNTSRCANTRSWDISFDAFVPDREFHGVDNLNVNGEPNDPSSSRSWLSWKLFNQMGVPSSRCVATSLTINGSFYGLHNCVENSDKGFMKAWFGDGNGPRFKCVYAQADLAWRGSNRDSYDGSSNLGDGSQGYEWKGADINADYTELISFIDFINNTSDSQFAAGIEARFDVDSFLRFLAVNVSVGSWDDYWYGSNNFGLFKPANSTRWQWIPYDFDNTFGVDFFGVNWATRPVDSNWKSGGFGTGNSPLVDRILNIQAYRYQYRRYLHELRTGYFSSATLDPVVDAHQTLVSAAGQADTRDSFSATTFNNSFSQPSSYNSGASTPAKWGIKPYIAARNSYIASNVSTPAALPNVFINEVLADNTIQNTDEYGEHDDWIELHNAEATTVSLAGMYLTDDFTSPTKWQFPAGSVSDIGPGGKLLVWCDNQTTQGSLHASFTLSGSGEAAALFHNDANNNVLIDGYGFPSLLPNRSYGRYPDAATTLTTFYVVTPNAPNDNTPAPAPGESPNLFINEFMASNLSVITDEFGQYDDWIEIYNDEPVPVDMSGMYLTDTLANPTKFQIPSGVVIGAKGFLLFWADSTPAQGSRHTNFGLSKSGEAIGLYDTATNSFALIDSVTFTAQTDNVSRGRATDGGTMGALSVPTPGVSNLLTPVTLSHWGTE
ncbi:MAG: CotH kinase family protein [Candidatus Sumerlaeaceae bacterium]|nr:CotH kinase family protein [Candidatus Sumerlaeaceae bacterium]